MRNCAVIDLGAIKSNALKVKRLIPYKTKFCAVVKADAYGHGAPQVANALYKIADSFAVALVEEGIQLRQSGIDKEILVLTRAEDSDLERAVFYGLTLTVTCVTDLYKIHRECYKQKKCANVHIKFNSGMNRHGASLEELKNILNKVYSCFMVDITGVYSHYAMPENEEKRKKATDKFLLAIKLVKSYNNNVVCHISASGGTLFGEYFDMVRIGIMLYGYTPFKTDVVKLKPAMKVYANVVGRRTVCSGESALYGDKRADKKTNLTIIRYGYADGLFRREKEGQFNNRCMDVSAIKDLKDNVKKINVLENVDKLAEDYHTINYEILTKAALRADKFYKK